MSKRKTIGTMIAGMVIGAAALPLVAFAAADTTGLKGINIQGVGNGDLATGDCAACLQLPARPPIPAGA